jgi:type IV fimbrial biogenesis protein FimT
MKRAPVTLLTAGAGISHCTPSMRGVTLIEMVVVIAILGVLIALAAPSMRSMMARQRVQGVNAELVTDLQMARAEVAKRSGASTLVAITFGGNGQMSCYTLHTTPTAGITCDCTRAPGTACTAAGTEEIKTVQLSRATGVAVAAGGGQIVFAPPQGLAAPANLVIDVQDTTSGQLRTTINALGRPAVCSPDGSIAGVPTAC